MRSREPAWFHPHPLLPTLLAQPAGGEPGPYGLNSSCRAGCLAAPQGRGMRHGVPLLEGCPAGVTPRACTVPGSKALRASCVRADPRLQVSERQCPETVCGAGKQCHGL